MGGSGSKSKGFWPFSGSGSVDDPTKDGNERPLARVRSFPGATPFVFTRRSSMYFDEDGDLAHEFYEETIVTKNGRKKAKLRRIQKNLTPQGIIRLDHPCIHVDFPVVLCEAWRWLSSVSDLPLSTPSCGFPYSWIPEPPFKITWSLDIYDALMWTGWCNVCRASACDLFLACVQLDTV